MLDINEKRRKREEEEEKERQRLMEEERKRDGLKQLARYLADSTLKAEEINQSKN